jgi:signal transduction histidine kinase/ActR/RegA family two-component response regulator
MANIVDTKVKSHYNWYGNICQEMMKMKKIKILCIIFMLITLMPINIVKANEPETVRVVFTGTDLTIADFAQMHPIITVEVCIAVILVILVIAFILNKNKVKKKYRESLEVKVDEITKLNTQLKENQDMLEETSAEMEAQLEEISALNDELEDKQNKLERALQQAEAANKAKTSFLFNMSHDIRTPMNAIIGFADLLEKHQENPERRADYLKKIQDSSSVLLSIINNVLEMARIEKGTLIIDEAPWSAQQFVDSLFSVFNDMMKQKNIEFTQEIDVVNPYVLCDPIKLREVYINIISNAYKYTNEGGKVHMSLKELPCDREGYGLYQTTISDTGMGMSEDFLPHIFEEFSRENNTTDNKIEGTGLGMPIVKRLVELMDGTIEVSSVKGEGSTFVVTLPHKIVDRCNLNTHSSSKINTEVFKGKRILLAEDNDLNAEIAIEILGDGGFEVERAEDGQICVDKLVAADDFYYDLILMDIQMPNLNGYEATKAIRALDDPAKAEIAIIAMTANAFEEDKRDAMKAGMNGHLAKPVDVHELYKTLTMLFAK